MILITNKTADLVCAKEYKDENHNWVIYGTSKVEEALVKHGYIPEGFKYKGYDTNNETLKFDAPMYLAYTDYDRMIFRLGVANIFFRCMLWCYNSFKLKNEPKTRF